MGAVEYRLSGGFWAPPLFDPSCNVADLASPYGVLDLADIGGFVQAFLAREPVADLDPPYGVFDLGDIATFVIEFEAGCPS
jgi:hypothetical protein